MDAQGLEPKNSGLLVTDSGLMHCGPLLGALWDLWPEWGDGQSPALPLCLRTLQGGAGERASGPGCPHRLSQPLCSWAPGGLQGQGLGFFKPKAQE